MNKLLEVMTMLRDPERGCPWDQAQTMQSIVPHTLEEAYELVDAIERKDINDIKSEVGDLLLQVIYYAQIAKENKWFDFHDIVIGLCNKLQARHSHVFSAQETLALDQLHQRWENQKLKERADKGSSSWLDDVPQNLPSLTRAQKLQKRAAMVGFDWEAVEPIFEKIQEEITECQEAIQRSHPENVAEEIGDLLFACVNLARHFKLDAESVLRQANHKFESRFRRMERFAAEMNTSLDTFSLKDLETLWQKSKAK